MSQYFTSIFIHQMRADLGVDDIIQAFSCIGIVYSVEFSGVKLFNKSRQCYVRSGTVHLKSWRESEYAYDVYYDLLDGYNFSHTCLKSDEVFNLVKAKEQKNIKQPYKPVKRNYKKIDSRNKKTEEPKNSEMNRESHKSDSDYTSL